MLNNNYHHNIEQKDCIVQSSQSHDSQITSSELKREISVVTANLHSGPTISTIEKASSSVAASNSPLYSSNNSDIYLLGHNKLSPNSNSHADNNNSFLSLNDLTAVLQQEHIIQQQTQSSSSSTSLSSPKQQSTTSSLPPSSPSSIFIASAATTTSTTPATTVFNNINNSKLSRNSYSNCNNTNNNNNNNIIDCSLTAGSQNCITPVSPLGSSSQSSGSALSLGNSLNGNSINGNSNNRINAHFNLNLQHISTSSRNHITGMNQKQHQTQYPQSPTNMSLGSSGPFSPIIENGNIPNSTTNGNSNNGNSIGGGGGGGGGGNGSGSSNSSIIGMSAAFSQTSLHQLQQNIYQNQQQLSSPSSLHRSISSTSSSMATSPMSVNSQHHQHYNQQPQQMHFHQRQNHHQHYLQHQQQQQQQHQHNHHHHSHHNQQPYSTNSPSNSKSCWCFGGDVTYHFKTLVPAVAAGAIIGKGGETIASLQRDTGARVKMSKSHDFYPGTSERVCLITGSIEAIMTVLDFIMDKIREKPDLTTKLTDIEAKQAQERDKQVKILVPNSTAGMIIGKAGAYIKQIKEESGSYVQISQKPKDITLQERCITIIGEKDNNKIACKMILAKIVEDSQSGTCLNVSYADVNGPVANYNPTGSPYATNQNAISSSTASLNSALGSTVGGTGLLVNGTGINLQLNLGPPNQSPNPTMATQLLDHIKQVYLRGSGYADNVASEIVAALGVLAKYGILGVGVGLPHTNGAHSAPVSYLGVSALEQSAAAATAAAAGSVFGALGQVNLEQFIGQSTAAPRQSLETATAAGPFDPFRHAGSQAATPISINNNSFGLAAATTGGATAQALGAQTLGVLSKSPTPGDLGTKDSRSVEVNESYIGTILGPNGRSLVEIQHVSGAIIQISKKGIFAPGTRNRIVTISGQPNAIAMARFLIEKKIHEEEAKRARQNPVTNVVQ